MRTIVAIKHQLQPQPPTPAMAVQQRSPWHSPVPYLFGGLAAMLGLIAFALLILACSYWKVSGQSDDREGGEGDLESGNGGDGKDHGENSGEAVKVFEEKILVIMAGNENPTYLATPVSVCSKFATLGGEKLADEEEEANKNGDKEESSEKSKDEFGTHEDDESVSTVENSETHQRHLNSENEEEAQH